MENSDLVFGPVPSRRLGQSLGINNTLLPKSCSYNCAYCQVGRTHHPEYTRRAFIAPRDVYEAVAGRLREAEARGIQIDYLSFVPDGEPTLDIRLGETIALLRLLGKPIAVFSNTSLIWRPDVRADLSAADWVSLKFDAVVDRAWRRIDRPNKHLQLPLIMEGALAFARQFHGELAGETMLCAGLNDDDENLIATAEFLARLQPAVAYIGVPTRPPVESWAKPPSEETIAKAYALFAARLPKVELIIGYPSPDFQSGSDAETGLPAILAVHPMRESEVTGYLQRSGTNPKILEQLEVKGIIKQVTHQGETFWVRMLQRDER